MPAIAPPAPPPAVPARPSVSPKPVVKSAPPGAGRDAPAASEFAQALEDALAEETTVAADADAAIAASPDGKPCADAAVAAGTANVVDETAGGESTPSSCGEPAAPQWMAAPAAETSPEDVAPIEDAEVAVAGPDEAPDAAEVNLLAGTESVTIAQSPRPIADGGPQAMPLQRLAATATQPQEAPLADAPQPEIPLPGDVARAEPADVGLELPRPDVIATEVDRPATGEVSPPQPAPVFERAIDTLFNAVLPQPAEAPSSSPVDTARPPAPEAAFVEDNHPGIVRDVRSAMAPDGTGKMEIRLDPPELGALTVKVEMRDGLITASFQTSSDEATRLLGHSLAQLKHSLESAGVTVDRLQVQQAPKQDASNQNFDRDPRRQDPQTSQDNTRHEQQRREMLQRLWQRLRNNGDPVDLFA